MTQSYIYIVGSNEGHAAEMGCQTRRGIARDAIVGCTVESMKKGMSTWSRGEQFGTEDDAVRRALTYQ